MSKGNLFMGFGRGKVGSVVLSRTKGQQVARAYNDKPKNPRSEGQMMQRSIFASAVKFYTQGRQAFYEFAFENKSAKNSDYNAFVSANAKRGMNISKMAFDESTYPVLAPWMMSKGSLPEIPMTYGTESALFSIELEGLSEGANLGDVSKALINLYGLMPGDIITVVSINAWGSNSYNTPTVEPLKRQAIQWDIKQAVIEPESTAAITTLFGAGSEATANKLSFRGIVTPGNIGGVAVTISRNTLDGLKVNDSYLYLNEMAATAYNASKESGYISEVLESWKASGKAILQGALI